MKRNILVAGLFLSSCRLLKKESLRQKTLIEKEAFQVIAERETISQQSEIVLIDSSDANYTLTLWPKGKFTYSLAKGFEGEAERLVLTGKNTQVKVLETKQKMHQQQSSLKANYTQEKESSKVIQKQKQKQSLGFSWGGIILLGLILIILFFGKVMLLKKKAA